MRIHHASRGGLAYAMTVALLLAGQAAARVSPPSPPPPQKLLMPNITAIFQALQHQRSAPSPPISMAENRTLGLADAVLRNAIANFESSAKNTPVEPLVNALAPLLNSSLVMSFANAMLESVINAQSGSLNITRLLQG
jgi:hypothetical protein